MILLLFIIIIIYLFIAFLLKVAVLPRLKNSERFLKFTIYIAHRRVAILQSIQSFTGGRPLFFW